MHSYFPFEMQCSYENDSELKKKKMCKLYECLQSNKSLCELFHLQASGTAHLDQIHSICLNSNSYSQICCSWLWFVLYLTSINKNLRQLSFFVFSGSTMTVSVFTVTSKSTVLRWSKYEGALSYRVTASLRNSQVPVVFASFGQNTIMGSVNSLNPNTAYTFRVEALGSNMNMLTDATVDGLTGVYWNLHMAC